MVRYPSRFCSKGYGSMSPVFQCSFNLSRSIFISPMIYISLFSPAKSSNKSFMFWPNISKSALGKVAQNHSSSPYEVMSDHYVPPNSHEKFTKREIRSSWTRFEHCSESLFYSTA